jgi:cell wall-associated NlpC family hydrolase
VPSLPGARWSSALTVAIVSLVIVLLAAVPAQAVPAEPDLAELDRQIATASDRLEVLVEERNALREDLAATQARAIDTAGRIAHDTAALDVLRDRTGAIAARAYRNGPVTGVRAVLAAGSPGTLLDQLTVLEALGVQARGEMAGLASVLTSLRRERAALAALEQTLHHQETALAELTATVERDLAQLQKLRSRTLVASAVVLTPPPLAGDGAAGAAVAYAYAQVGKAYKYGTAGPNTFDCSGLTKAAWAAAGVSLPHNAARQYQSMAHVTRAALAPGDLIFYYSDIHHVALYIGNGMVIHAPHTGDVVRVAGIDMAPIYGYGRP